MTYILIFFFFFQAEDGIRDVAVTGVQTCALPILCGGRRKGSAHRDWIFHYRDGKCATGRLPTEICARPSAIRIASDFAGATRGRPPIFGQRPRSEEHTSELQSRLHLVCRLLLEKKKTQT